MANIYDAKSGKEGLTWDSMKPICKKCNKPIESEISIGNADLFLWCDDCANKEESP